MNGFVIEQVGLEFAVEFQASGNLLRHEPQVEERRLGFQL